MNRRIALKEEPQESAEPWDGRRIGPFDHRGGPQWRGLLSHLVVVNHSTRTLASAPERAFCLSHGRVLSHGGALSDIGREGP